MKKVTLKEVLSELLGNAVIQGIDLSTMDLIIVEVHGVNYLVSLTAEKETNRNHNLFEGVETIDYKDLHLFAD